jgi:hypothetical protein
MATDPPGGFQAGLDRLMSGHAGRSAIRLAVAIGRDAKSEALNQFIGDPEIPVLVADNPEDITDRLVAVSIALSRMSEAGADRKMITRRLFGPQRASDPGVFGRDTII